jgi:hypothetical protein
MIHSAALMVELQPEALLQGSHTPWNTTLLLSLQAPQCHTALHCCYHGRHRNGYRHTA